MPVSIVSASPTVTVTGGTTPTLVLQPGTVISAQVLSVLDANLVRIAIANMTLDVQSLVPLQAGTTLSLAVSQTSQGGVQLTIVPADTAAAQAASSNTTAAAGQATDTSAIARTAPASTVIASTTLTPAQAAAITAASQAAAARQSGLSGLFANLGATVESLPAPLQQAAAQLLAARPVLTTALSAADVQSAFQSSGLFLEAGLAGGPLLPGQAGGPPDLKAALLVFRQLLSTYGDEVAAPATADQVNPAAAAAEVADATAHGAGSGTASSTPPAGGSQALEAAVVLLAGEEAAPLVPGSVTQAAGGAVFAALQQLDAQPTSPAGSALAQQAGTADAATSASRAMIASSNVPPPYRGAAPATQAVMSPSIASDAATHEVVRRLAADTDGAIARQTLLQIASLPGQGDAAAVDRAAPRWNFEIPFATPQGTAVAQLEIAGDGGQATAAGQKVWRARFTLNVEPAGPVHATVSLMGGTTSVRMWAERPQTAAQLRANAPQLGAALRQADLEPGDIVIGDGAPSLPAMAAPAGRFLDRAT